MKLMLRLTLLAILLVMPSVAPAQSANAEAADQGHNGAQHQLVAMPSLAPAQGDNAEIAYERRDVTALTRMADAGDSVAQFNLGKMYEFGLGVPQDDVMANSWYRQAADQGHTGAQNTLGVNYASGQGVPKDDVTAVSWYREAAARGWAASQFNLGQRYRYGRGVAQDRREALRLLREAADQGYSDAQIELGNIYRQPHEARAFGIDVREGEALRLLLLAYNNGNSNASKAIGDAFRFFREEADLHWYRISAAQGNSDAQIALGRVAMYRKDYESALSWAQMAEAADPYHARLLIESIADSRRADADAARAAEAERYSQEKLSLNYRGRIIKYERRWRSGIINSCLDIIIARYNPTRIEVIRTPWQTFVGRFSDKYGFFIQNYIAWLPSGNGKTVFCAHKGGIGYRLTEDFGDLVND